MPKNKSSVFYPILFGVLAILFTLAILVGWSILFTDYYILSNQLQPVPKLGAKYWLMLACGYLFLMSIVTVLLLQLIGYVRKTLYVRQQDSFIDGVTHEFKSPLASIQLCLETIEMRDVPEEIQKKFHGMMKKDVERLIAFVEHILEAGRLDHDERIMKYEETSLVKATKECIEHLQKKHALQNNQIIFETELDESEARTFTDPVAYETILLNLLDNAVKYSFPPVEIRIKLELHQQTFKISVTDKGVGIPKRQLKKVFRRFYRIRNENSTKARGTGLGLYVVSSLAKRLSGKITAFSEGEGSGSTFLLEIPLKEAEKSEDID